MKRTNAVLAALACLLFTTRSFADQPMPWQMGMQPSVTPIMSQVRWFEEYRLCFIGALPPPAPSADRGRLYDRSGSGAAVSRRPVLRSFDRAIDLSERS